MRTSIAALFRDDNSLRRIGLIVERLSDGTVRANVPHVPFYSPNGFEIGYGGSGPADLALAVMHALLPPLLTPEEQIAAFGDDTSTPRADLADLLANPQCWSQPIGEQRIHVSDLAFMLHQRFKWRFLLNVPDGNTLFIPIRDIEAWIESEKACLHR